MVRRPLVTRRLALAWIERCGVGNHRDELVRRATGKVLELGCADGRNFESYIPAVVEALVAIEPEPVLVAKARRRADDVTIDIEVQCQPFDLESVPDSSFDTVVMSFCLCRASEPQVLLRDVSRVLKPGGELLFFEHHRSLRFSGVLQRGVTPLWRRFFSNCHLDRDSVLIIRNERFSIGSCDRFRLPGTRLLFGDTALGVARPNSVHAPIWQLDSATPDAQ